MKCKFSLTPFTPTGFSLNLMVAPLGADLTHVVDTIEGKNHGMFGNFGAYGHVFALYNCALAVAGMLGPLLAGILANKTGWKTMSLVLGIFGASGAIPVVRTWVDFIRGDKAK